MNSEPCHVDYGMGAVNFAHESNLIAIGRPDGTVSVNSLPLGTFHREWKFDSGAKHLAFHPHLPQIAIAVRDGVQIRDYESGRLLVRFEEAAGATFLAWHPHGLLLATADADLGITLWDPQNVRRHKALRGHDNTGIQLEFNSSGTMLLSSAWDGALRVWDPRDGTLVMTPITISALRCAADRDVWIGALESGRTSLLQADAHEVYTRLNFETSASPEPYTYLSIGRQGIARSRLLAASTERGVRFWDLATKSTIGFLPIGSVKRMHFDDSGALWTNSPAGVLRLPIQESTDEPGTLVVGPASSVLPAGSDADLAVTPDGRTLACGGTAGAFVWHADRPDSRLELARHGDPRYVSISPDGRWIATGSHTESRVKIWDAETGAPVRDLGLAGSRVEFSPDGKWLATTGGGLALWSVGDWNRSWGGVGFSLSGHAFGADGRIIAVEVGTGAIVLYESNSGREVARLTDPSGHRQTFLAFSPDARYLAGISYNFRNLCVWDLHEIDVRLKELGVPWEWPVPRAAPADESQLVPLKIVTRVESRSEALARQLDDVTRQLGNSPQDTALHLRRGWLLYALDRQTESIDDLTQAIDLAANAASYSLRAHSHAAANDYPKAIADAMTGLSALSPDDPRQAEFCNHLAWYFVTAPTELRRPEKAVALARRALRGEPGRAAYLNTLGVAQCLNGDWDEAMDALRRSLKAGSEAPACDWYFLALCQHHLHDEHRATEAFEQAVYWHDIHEHDLDRQTRRELAAIRDEVAAILAMPREVRENMDHRQEAEPNETDPP